MNKEGDRQPTTCTLRVCILGIACGLMMMHAFVILSLLIVGVQSHPKKPHILYIIMDDMGWGDVGRCFLKVSLG